MTDFPRRRNNKALLEGRAGPELKEALRHPQGGTGRARREKCPRPSPKQWTPADEGSIKSTAWLICGKCMTIRMLTMWAAGRGRYPQLLHTATARIVGREVSCAMREVALAVAASIVGALAPA
jgi:hypothetical protein